MTTPTIEQQAIIDSFPIHQVLKVNAVAGSGKSSTLRMLADRNNIPSLYVCFNKANATEAARKFPSNVECRTLHSLAYAEFGRPLVDKLSTGFVRGEAYVNKARSNKEIARLYGISDMVFNPQERIKAVVTAAIIKDTVNAYQNSADETITQQNIPMSILRDMKKGYPSLDLRSYIAEILRISKRLWNDRCDVNSPVAAHHDTYLKLWQLSKPVLSYDVIYVDEAQDTNPVCFDVLLRQKAKMVYVGDAYQSIYAFRGAVNAMEKIVAPTYTLSKSFRYGEKIALAASEILRDVTVKGLETINSRISTLPDDVKYTMIFRTNAGLVEKAVQLFLDGKKVNCNIDVRQFENRLLSIKALREDKHEDIKDDTIALFASWNELVEAFDEHRDLKMMADIVLSGKINEYLAVLRDISQNSTDYDVMLTTAHKSKGCEWDHVKIATDFDFETIFTTRPDKYDQQEVNLFYVAVTRAIKVLVSLL